MQKIHNTGHKVSSNDVLIWNIVLGMDEFHCVI